MIWLFIDSTYEENGNNTPGNMLTVSGFKILTPGASVVSWFSSVFPWNQLVGKEIFKSE